MGDLAVLPPALFIAPHPDDEQLGMSVAIAKHLAAGQAVHVLWLTDGSASAARDRVNGLGTPAPWWNGIAHHPEQEGYVALTGAAFGAARLNESKCGIRALCSGYPGAVSFHEGGLPDGGVSVSMAETLIWSLCESIAPGQPVRLKTTSHLVDNHDDHVAAGQAILNLSVQEPARFNDCRWYVLPTYWADPRLAQVAEVSEYPTDAAMRGRIKNALMAFGAWAPDRGAYAIGQHSTPSLFSQLRADTRSMYHGLT